MNEKDPRVEVFFVPTFCFYLDTSKTSTRVGKKEVKEESFYGVRG